LRRGISSDNLKSTKHVESTGLTSLDESSILSGSTAPAEATPQRGEGGYLIKSDQTIKIRGAGDRQSLVCSGSRKAMTAKENPSLPQGYRISIVQKKVLNSLIRNEYRQRLICLQLIAPLICFR
jgi:hypothetical protein